MSGPRPASLPSGWWLVLAAALVVAAFLSPLASRNPDGLNRVAQDHGFAARERGLAGTPFARYTVPGLAHPRASTAVAGLLGTLLTFGAGWSLAALVARKRSGGRKVR
jgi:hypothetical protein